MPKKQVIKKSAQSPVALIAGGAGFIGSGLVEVLLAQKARVVVLDNFNTGKELHIQDYLINSKFALFNVDVNQGIPAEIESVDYVFHLAGVEEYLYSKDFLNLDALLTNSYGTKNLLDLARKSKAKFLLASSTDVYQGRMSQVDLASYFGSTSEEEKKYSLVEAKRFAEALVWEYYKRHDIDARIVRLPEVFGPKMNLESSGVLGRFLKNLVEGQDITIYGDGYAKEYYLYIEDVISGIVKSTFGSNTKGTIYSFINGAPVSELEVAFMLKGIADRELDIQFRPGGSSARPKLLPPDTVNHKAIGWKPKYTFKQAVLKTLAGLGYATNERGFKPAKFIDQKKQRKGTEVATLQGSKEVVSKKPATTAPKSPPKTVATTIAASPKPTPVARILPLKPRKVKLREKSVAKSAEVSRGITLGVPPDLARKYSKRSKIPRIQLKFLGKLKNLIPKNKVSKRVSARVVSVFIALTFSGLITFLILPGLSLYSNVSKGFKSLEQLPDAVYRLDASLVSQRAEESYRYMYKAKKSLGNLKWSFVLLGKQDKYYAYDKMITSLAHFSKAAYTLSDVVEPFGGLWDVIRPDSSSTLDKETFIRALSSLSTAKNHLKLAEAEFKYVDDSYFPSKYSSYITQYGSALSLGLGEIDLVANLLADLPEILGVGGGKKYVVWFQNSNELRATGGFIGSYGILEFNEGKLTDLTIDDIYNPDGQLDLRNITVAPPKPIADYLAEDRTYLRNSNWNPDFPASAEVFKDLYFKVTGDEVDGVIAVDLDFTKKLLDAVGPVFLTAYNEEISSENLYERTQFYAEFNYENGSDQKRSFLTVLGSKLLERLFSLDQNRLPLLLAGLGASLEEKHLLVYMPDLPISAFVKEKGWDGSLVTDAGNYLYVVNSNLGGNKAGYFVEPSMKFEVEALTRDGLLRGMLTLDYEHFGEDEAWPGGVYKDYIRVFTGMGAKLTSAKLYNHSKEETNVFEDVAISQESGKTVFGFGVEVAPLETTRLVLGFDLPKSESLTKENKTFGLYWQKQPGTQDTKAEFILTPPFGMDVVGISDNLELSSKMVKFSDLLNTDQQFYVKFQ
jgi:UDP-glucuronate decarboxylase